MNSETLISASVQGGVLAAAVWLIVRALPSMSPIAKVWLWRLVFLKFALGFVGLGNIPLHVLPPARQVIEPLATGVQYAAVDTREVVSGPAVDWQLVWLIGALLVAGLTLARVSRTLSMVRRSTPVTDSWKLDELGAILAKEHIRSAPRLLESAESRTAFLAMGLRPAIVLPRDIQDRNDVRLMLAHEIAHLANRDLAWNVLATCVKSAFFFHPLVWLSAGRAHIAQESAADQRAVRTTGVSMKIYGEMLLRATVAADALRSIPGAVAVAGSIRGLRERLDAMSRFTEKPPLPLRLAAFAAVAALLPGYVLVAQTAPPEKGATGQAAGRPPLPPKRGAVVRPPAAVKGKQRIREGWVRVTTKSGKETWVRIRAGKGSFPKSGWVTVKGPDGKAKTVRVFPQKPDRRVPPPPKKLQVQAPRTWIGTGTAPQGATTWVTSPQAGGTAPRSAGPTTVTSQGGVSEVTSKPARAGTQVRTGSGGGAVISQNSTGGTRVNLRSSGATTTVVSQKGGTSIVSAEPGTRVQLAPRIGTTLRPGKVTLAAPLGSVTGSMVTPRMSTTLRPGKVTVAAPLGPVKVGAPKRRTLAPVAPPKRGSSASRRGREDRLGGAKPLTRFVLVKTRIHRLSPGGERWIGLNQR